jgi:hypothetical protein
MNGFKFVTPYLILALEYFPKDASRPIEAIRLLTPNFSYCFSDLQCRSTISARHIGGLHHLCILELVRAPGPHMRSFLVVW